MNYLQYLNTVNRNHFSAAGANFLVSGADPMIRQVIGQHLTETAYAEGRTLFLLDNTSSSSGFSAFGPYRVVDALSGGINFCGDLFNVSTLQSISRLRSLLSDFGFSSAKAMQVVTFLSFVKETEARLGSTRPLDLETIESYGGPALVQWKLHQLVERGTLTAENYEFLLSRYTEVSAASADFEMLLGLLVPFLSGQSPTGKMAVHLPLGEFDADKSMQEVLCKMLLSYVKQTPETCSILILDSGKGERSCILELLKKLPPKASVHLLSTDVFSLEESDLSILMNTFPVRIYSRHESMSSCAKIESICGQIDVVKRSYTTTVDKHIRASSAFDMLLGTNRTESVARNAPVREARFRKELLNSLSSGSAVIDCGGTQALFQF